MIKQCIILCFNYFELKGKYSLFFFFNQCLCTSAQQQASTQSSRVWGICKHYSTFSFKISLSVSLNDELWSVVAWGPIKSRFQSRIRWYTHIYMLFFFMFGCPRIPIWPTWWIFSGYWAAGEAKIPTRCGGHDLQIIRLKQGWGFLLWTLCFPDEHHNVVGCPAASFKKERERERIKEKDF